MQQIDSQAPLHWTDFFIIIATKLKITSEFEIFIQKVWFLFKKVIYLQSFNYGNTLLRQTSIDFQEYQLTQ